MSRSLESSSASAYSPSDVSRFTNRARMGLEHAGFSVFELSGSTMTDIIDVAKGRIVVGVSQPDRLMAHRSRASEVAIEVQQPQLLMWSTRFHDSEHVSVKARNTLGLRIGGIDLRTRTKTDRSFMEDIAYVLGTPADYAELGTMVPESRLVGSKMKEPDRRLVRTDFVTADAREIPAREGTGISWMPGPLKEPGRSEPARVAVVRSSNAKVLVLDIPVTQTGEDVLVVPLIVPQS